MDHVSLNPIRRADDVFLLFVAFVRAWMFVRRLRCFMEASEGIHF
jgi:hypothetical protein